MGNEISTCRGVCSEESAVRTACEYIVTPAETYNHGRTIYHVGPGENINDINDPKKRRLHSSSTSAKTSSEFITGNDEVFPPAPEMGPASFQNLPGIDGSQYRGYATENGVRHGEGLLLFNDGIKIYQGQWEKGQMHGFGRFEDEESQFEGHWEQDYKHGHGLEKWLDDGSKYEGDYSFGKKEGFGKYSWSDGSSYEGDFIDNKIEGHGQYLAEDCVYVGQFVDNVKQGYGLYTWNDGRVYDGQFAQDLKNGFGTMKWADGYAFSGMWENGYRHGRGKVIWPNGTEQEVEFANDRPLKILKRKRNRSKGSDGSKTGEDDTESVVGSKPDAGDAAEVAKVAGRHSVGMRKWEEGAINDKGHTHTLHKDHEIAHPEEQPSSSSKRPESHDVGGGATAASPSKLEHSAKKQQPPAEEDDDDKEFMFSMNASELKNNVAEAEDEGDILQGHSVDKRRPAGSQGRRGTMAAHAVK